MADLWLRSRTAQKPPLCSTTDCIQMHFKFRSSNIHSRHPCMSTASSCNKQMASSRADLMAKLLAKAVQPMDYTQHDHKLSILCRGLSKILLFVPCRNAHAGRLQRGLPKSTTTYQRATIMQGTLQSYSGNEDNTCSSRVSSLRNKSVSDWEEQR
jgi:hypothetical protein